MTVPWISANNGRAWGTLKLGGLTMPGLVKVGVELSEEIEIKKPKGAIGATTTYQGREPASVQIVVTLYDSHGDTGAAQLAEMEKMIAVVRPKVTKDPKKASSALSIEHPKCTMWGISSVTVQKISDPPDDNAQMKTITFSCVEFKPPPAGAKPATKTEKSLDPRSQGLAKDLGEKSPADSKLSAAR